MGVYIKGMEMPKNCAVCRLEKDLFGRAVCFGYEDGRALNKDDLPPVGNDERRPSWCPLVPIPPHGRLIDADALMKIISKVIGINASIEKRNEATDQERRCLWWFEQQIGIAPTIIEAEEGE